MAAVVIVAAAGLWLPQLTSSFTADETVTNWVIRDGVRQTLDRSYQFEQQHSLYFLIESAVKRTLGSSELALRMPSILAMGVALWLVWRLGRRLGGEEMGFLTAAVFATSPGIIFAAGDARPYALAILGLIGSSLALVRWADTQSKRDAVAYVLLAAATLYFHYLVAIALAVHPLYVWLRRDRIRPSNYGVALAAIAVLMIPAIPHAYSVFQRRGILEINIPVSGSDLFTVLFPSVLVGSIALGALISWRWGPVRILKATLQPAGPSLILGLWILPPGILFAITKVGSTLFEPRYLFFALPGMALVGGAAIRSLDPERARRLTLVTLAVVALILFNTKTHSGEDWRGAADVERVIAASDTPVLFRPNFIEAKQIDWLSRPAKLEYLSAELVRYPMRGRIFPIPYDLTDAAKRYLKPVLERLRSSNRFVLVNDRGAFQPWLEGRFPGYTARRVPGGGLVTLVLFEKRAG